jgi:NAD(P)-dependent dehydrogenase (short-subunit alcohol dehydrogenase family)
MAELDLSGRRALVTGGAGGIGAAICRRLALAGATVVVADIDGTAAAELAVEISGEAWQVDLSDTAALAALTLDVGGRGGRVLVPARGRVHDRNGSRDGRRLDSPLSVANGVAWRPVDRSLSWPKGR